VIERLQALLERPIAEHERRRAFALAASVVLIAAVGLLALGRAADDAPRRVVPAPEATERPAPAPSPPPGGAGVEGAGLPDGVPPRGVESAARRFLDGYLGYLYGRGPVSAIRAAAPELARRLSRARLRISPATRHRRPRVAELSAQRLGRGGEIVVAQIADGDIAHYPIELVLERRSGRWLVARVEAD
jgi:hypothetical protein